MTLLVMAAEAGLALAAYNAEAGGNNDDGISAVLAKFFQLSIWAVALQGMLHTYIHEYKCFLSIIYIFICV
jgi:hypothetical protein